MGLRQPVFRRVHPTVKPLVIWCLLTITAILGLRQIDAAYNWVAYSNCVPTTIPAC